MPHPVTASLHVAASSNHAAKEAAELVTQVIEVAIAARGQARIAISGGSTPRRMLELLADPAYDFVTRISWTKLHLFWVDERCVPPTHDESNFRMTNEAMLSKIEMPARNIHRMEGELEPAVAAARYEADIRNTFRLEGAQTPNFDLILLGMGPDGHTASLFPHTDALEDITDIVVANHVPQKDTWRLTLTSPVINWGREVVFQVEGAAKAGVLASVLLGPYTPETYPSQLVRPSNGRLTFLLDEAAAAKLPHTSTLALT